MVKTILFLSLLFVSITSFGQLADSCTGSCPQKKCESEFETLFPKAMLEVKQKAEAAIIERLVMFYNSNKNSISAANVSILSSDLKIHRPENWFAMFTYQLIIKAYVNSGKNSYLFETYLGGNLDEGYLTTLNASVHSIVDEEKDFLGRTVSRNLRCSSRIFNSIQFIKKLSGLYPIEFDHNFRNFEFTPAL